jgi:hypothetical protein
VNSSSTFSVAPARTSTKLVKSRSPAFQARISRRPVSTRTGASGVMPTVTRSTLTLTPSTGQSNCK